MSAENFSLMPGLFGPKVSVASRLAGKCKPYLREASAGDDNLRIRMRRFQGRIQRLVRGTKIIVVLGNLLSACSALGQRQEYHPGFAHPGLD